MNDSKNLILGFQGYMLLSILYLYEAFKDIYILLYLYFLAPK